MNKFYEEKKLRRIITRNISSSSPNQPTIEKVDLRAKMLYQSQPLLYSILDLPNEYNNLACDAFSCKFKIRQIKPIFSITKNRTKKKKHFTDILKFIGEYPMTKEENAVIQDIFAIAQKSSDLVDEIYIQIWKQTNLLPGNERNE